MPSLTSALALEISNIQTILTNNNISFVSFCSCIHSISVFNRDLLSIIGKHQHLSVNKRIYIGGKVKTENVSNENVRLQNLEVIANEIFLTNSNIDQNNVELLAFIVSNIRNDQNSSAFSIATHFTVQ